MKFGFLSVALFSSVMLNGRHLLLVIPNKLLLLLPNARHVTSHDAACSRAFFMGLSYTTLSVYYSSAPVEQTNKSFMK